MARRKQQTQTRVNHDSTIFVCQLCHAAGVAPVVETETYADFVAHAVAAHELTEEQIKASTGAMRAHVDAAEWHQTDYAFTLADGRPLVWRSVRLTRRVGWGW